MTLAFKLIRLLPLGIMLAFAAWARFWAVPLSAGPDVAQFWGFAETFRLHGLDFYRYAAGNGELFSHQGWAYVYPPVWLLLLGAVYLVVPGATASADHVDTAWRWAEKTPIIAADLLIGVLIYRFVPGAIWKKLLFSAAWLLNPAVWYQSAIFGQFDSIAVAMMFGAFLLIEKGHDRWGFLLAGIAVLTKQHTLIPLAMMMAALARTMSLRRLFQDLLIFGGVIVAVSIPFIATGAVADYGRYVVLGAHAPGYQVPLPYAFSGVGAILTWLHDDFQWNTLPYLQASPFVLVGALLLAAIFVYRRKIAPLPAMLIGLFIFLALFYRVNYQYLVLYMPLVLLAAARTRYVIERLLGILLVIYPIGWLWMFGTTLWFELYEPVADWTVPLLVTLRLDRWWLIPDSVYALYAGVLTALYTWYVIGLFTRWRYRTAVLDPPQGKEMASEY